MRFLEHPLEPVELNLTPLIDVVFLLLIFFMVSTTFERESQISVRLPQAVTDQREQAPEQVEVVIGSDGAIHVAGQTLVNSAIGTVRAALARVAEGRRDLPLVIRADRNSPYQAIVTVMDAGAQLGLLRIALPTLRVDD